MIKKYFLLVSILIILIGGMIMVNIQRKSLNIKKFDISDYQYYIENFSLEENVGSIVDSKDAQQKAEKIWIKLYGESTKKEKPYQVFYDENSKVWLVHGSIKPTMKGGAAHILIENTGKVLAVWHEK